MNVKQQQYNIPYPGEEVPFVYGCMTTYVTLYVTANQSGFLYSEAAGHVAQPQTGTRPDSGSGWVVHEGDSMQN